MKNIVSHDEIYSTYRDKVFSYIKSRISNYQDAEDLCEDVFVKVYEKLDSFDEKKASLSTWIYNITKNTVIDHYRTNHMDLEIIDNYDYPQEPVDEEPDEETLQFLAQALKQLPQELRDLIVLRYYNELSLKEVAEKMKMSYGIVKLRHKEALFRMKMILKDKI